MKKNKKQMVKKKNKGMKYLNKAVFVDVDYTLVKGSTVILLMKFLFLKKRISLIKFFKILLDYYFKIYRVRRINPKKVKTRLKVTIRGDEKELEKEYFKREIKPRINKKVLKIIRHYQKKGFLIVIASATFCYLIKSLSEFVNADFVLCSTLNIKDGYLLVKELSYSTEKAERIKSLADKEKINLKESVGLTDSIEDLPMTELLGKIILVNPSRELKSIGIKNGWRIIRGG